jgi:hypothetical protein
VLGLGAVDGVRRSLDEIGGMVSVISNLTSVPPALRRVRRLPGKLRAGNDGPHPCKRAASRTFSRPRAQLASLGDCPAEFAVTFWSRLDHSFNVRSVELEKKLITRSGRGY